MIESVESLEKEFADLKAATVAKRADERAVLNELEEARKIEQLKTDIRRQKARLATAEDSFSRTVSGASAQMSAPVEVSDVVSVPEHIEPARTQEDQGDDDTSTSKKSSRNAAPNKE